MPGISDSVGRLDGSLSKRLNCGKFKNIKTPFSENQVDVTGLNYVEFNTKLSMTSRSGYYRVRLLLDDVNFKKLSEYVIVSTKDDFQCTGRLDAGCLDNLSIKNIDMAMGFLEEYHRHGTIISKLECS